MTHPILPDLVEQCVRVVLRHADKWASKGDPFAVEICNAIIEDIHRSFASKEENP